MLGRRRIVAVIRGDDQQVAIPQLRQQLRKPGVETLQVARVPFHIVTVTVLRVSKSTRFVTIRPSGVCGSCRIQLIHALIVVGRVQSPA